VQGDDELELGTDELLLNTLLLDDDISSLELETSTELLLLLLVLLLLCSMLEEELSASLEELATNTCSSSVISPSRGFNSPQDNKRTRPKRAKTCTQEIGSLQSINKAGGGGGNN
jgi:hypothetical protein